MKTLKIPEETHLKIRKLQMYFKAKTISKTLEEMIKRTAEHEFEYNDLGYGLFEELINDK